VLTNTPWGYIIGLKTEAGDDKMENGNKCCECCRHKATPRSDETVKALQNRLSRIIGQLGGIKNMLDDNRYCGDILIQLAAAQNALRNVGYIILEEHMETCVAEGIKNGDDEVIAEAVELIKKLK